MRLILLAAMLALAFTGCDTALRKESGDGNGDIRNKIDLKSEGLTVKQAFLLFADDGKLVPADNKVEIGQKVNMRLIIEGWEPVDGKVYIGASEKISTDEGQAILNSEDLFAAYAEGVGVKDAGAVTLSAVITRIDKLFKYFVVDFRVWDKKSSDAIEGSYKLYLK